MAIREERETKGIRKIPNKRNPKWKEVKLSVYRRQYLRNPKDAARKLLELISESGKVARYKINT